MSTRQYPLAGVRFPRPPLVEQSNRIPGAVVGVVFDDGRPGQRREMARWSLRFGLAAYEA